MNWFGQNEIDVASFRKADFDMILKLKAKKPTEYQYIYDFQMVDASGNEFFLSYSLENLDEKFYQADDVLKIRSVAEM